MMGALREWLTSLVVTAMLLSLVQALIPEGTIRRIASFTGGLILMITLLHPLLGADPERLELGLADYQEEIESRQRALEEAGNAELTEIIADRTAAYISDKADALGVSVQGRVQVEAGKDGIPVPVSVELRGSWSEPLAAYIEQELGIPGERQVWHED